MNYQKHYKLLCERAKNRQLDCYTENHHIIPKCLGGDDSVENLVALTPEEHYVAHQLLVKMHPNHQGLIWSALMMTGQPNGKRNNNKVYGWLKNCAQKIAKARKGKKNGSFGRFWYHHPETLENKKCLPDEVPNGFVKGRRIKRKRKQYPQSNCEICGSKTGNHKRKRCLKHRYSDRKHSSEFKKQRSEEYKNKGNPAFGKIWITNGKISRRIDKQEKIPEGWKRGKQWTRRLAV